LRFRAVRGADNAVTASNHGRADGIAHASTQPGADPGADRLRCRELELLVDL
jgi:hypothetical protein